MYSGDIAAAVGFEKILQLVTHWRKKQKSRINQVPEQLSNWWLSLNLKADQDKMGIALQKLAEEDQHSTETNPETGETVISGMGELHLDVLTTVWTIEIRCSSSILPWNIPRFYTSVDSSSQSGGKGQFWGDVGSGTPREDSRVPKNAIVRWCGSREFYRRKDFRIYNERYFLLVTQWLTWIETLRWFIPRCRLSETAFKIAASLALKEAARLHNQLSADQCCNSSESGSRNCVVDV